MEFTPYLSFHGNAAQAQKFYQSVFGGELETQHAKDLFDTDDEQTGKLVVHSVLTIDDHFQITALDILPGAPKIDPGDTVSMGLHFDDVAQAQIVFDKLGVKGTVIIDLSRKGWGGTFGIVTDQFGVRWNIDA